MSMLQREGGTASETEAAVFRGNGHAASLGHPGDELSTLGGQFPNPAGGFRQVGRPARLAVSLSLAGLPDCSVMLAVAVGQADFGVWLCSRVATALVRD
jgi:hypothetical protein